MHAIKGGKKNLQEQCLRCLSSGNMPGIQMCSQGHFEGQHRFNCWLEVCLKVTMLLYIHLIELVDFVCSHFIISPHIQLPLSLLELILSFPQNRRKASSLPLF